MAIARDQDVELTVTTLAHGGLGIARLDGRVVFVSDAIPGETVRARVNEQKKSFWRADTIEVLEASPHRREHIWAEASVSRAPEDRAGGADLGHINLPHQRELKQQVLRESLARFAKVERDTPVEPAPGDTGVNGLGYRTRVSLHVAAGGTVGPYASRSNRVIPVASLPLATAEVAAAAPIGQKMVGVQRVDVLIAAEGGARLIIDEQSPSPIIERVGEREFQLDDGGFWQVHRSAAQVLTSAVQDAIIDERFDASAENLDLYGGVGLLAAAVGDRFGEKTRITSVESDERATEHAAENLADWLGARVVNARVDRFLGDLEGSLGAKGAKGATVVLDPPRAGAGREVVQRLVALAPAQIVYVACDPVAFSRDVGYFAELGWRLDKLRAFDLFPHTHHLEAVGTLVPIDA